MIIGAHHDPPGGATNSTETSAPEQKSDQTPDAGPLNSSVLSVDQEMNISDLIGNNFNFGNNLNWDALTSQ